MAAQTPAELRAAIDSYRTGGTPQPELGRQLSLASVPPLLLARDADFSDALVRQLDRTRVLGLNAYRDAPYARSVASNLAASLAVILDTTINLASEQTRVLDLAIEIATSIESANDDGPPPEQLVERAELLAVHLGSGRTQTDIANLLDWVATIVYGYVALWASGRQSRVGNELHGISIASLVLLSNLRPQDVDGVQADVEQLLTELTSIAQDPTSSRQISDLATSHLRDGRALLLGPDGLPRELPSAPRTLYGWITDAVELIARARPIAASGARQFLDEICSTPTAEPMGLQRALESTAKTSFAKDALARAQAGSLSGIESGTQQLFERVISHPARTVASAAALGAAVYAQLEGYPWLSSAVRALVRLVHARA